MKTASRIFMTFIMLAFFSGMTFSQVASTGTPGKTSTRAAVAAPGKACDAGKSAACCNHESKGTCAQGKNFVDKNGDGKCDNCGTAGKCKQAGNCGAGGPNCEKGCGKGQGKGNCGEKCSQHKTN